MTKENDLSKREILKQRGKKIRSRREELKLTQEQLGEMCGWTQKRISFYESGDREADAESLMLLARALKVAPSFFYPDQQNNIYQLPLRQSIVAAVKKLPLLTVYEAINLRSKEYMDKKNLDPNQKLIAVANDTPENAALIQVIDDSMVNVDKASIRTFAPGEIVMIDQDLKPELTDIVLAVVPNSDKAILRQYWFNSATNKHQLIPFNGYYQTIDIDTGVSILGVVIQKITRFR